MLLARPLGAPRDDVLDVLSTLIGDTAARKFVTGLESTVEQRARAGAEDAIPQIRSEVRTEVVKRTRIWILLAIALGGTSLLLSSYMLIRRRKGRR